MKKSTERILTTHAGRNRGQEGLLNFHALERSFEILDVCLQGGLAYILEGLIAEEWP